jgi:hypothetical protein
MWLVRLRLRPTVGTVQVGSLIFVVIVAIWAAYLLQHWVSRREDAAATRSVEGFSAAMRVLEKRPLLPRTDVGAPRPDSYSLKPAAGVRAVVDVKRAVPAGLARLSSPLVARRASEHPQARSSEIDQRRPSDALRGEVDPMPVSHSSPAPSRRPVARPVPHRVSMGRRRLRAGLLLTALLWVPLSLVLALTGVLLWASVPFAVVTLGVVLYWLRTEAEADRAHRAQRSQGRRPAPTAAPVRATGATAARSVGATAVKAAFSARSGAWLRPPATTQVSAPQPSSDDTQVIHHDGGAARSVRQAAAARGASEAPAARTASDDVFDVQAAPPRPAAAAAAPSAPAAVAPAQEAAPGSWSPVPVPTPTYALKAKAEPRLTDDGIPADVFDTPEFADEADELDDRALFARRAVSQ